jgi:hypothetical protein
MALLDALRALSSFDPPPTLPPCDLDELLEVLDGHGLAPLASYHLETRRIGAALPAPFRERLLALYQGVLNDNVFKLLTLKGALRDAAVPVVVLGAAAYLDWLYPHLAFRPVGDPRLLVRGIDGAAFAAAVAPEFRPDSTGEGGHTATFTNGQFELLQEGLVRGREDDLGLFARREPFPGMGGAISRPALEDALLATVSDVAQQGLYAPLLEYVDLRELVLRLPPERAPAVRERAVAAGLARGLAGALLVVERYFPQVGPRAATLAPELGRAERAAVDAVVDQAQDPAKLRVVRGAQEAARAVVGPA